MESLPNTTHRRHVTFLQSTCSPGSQLQYNIYLKKKTILRSCRTQRKDKAQAGTKQRGCEEEEHCVCFSRTQVTSRGASGPAGNTQRREKVSASTKNLLHDRQQFVVRPVCETALLRASEPWGGSSANARLTDWKEFPSRWNSFRKPPRCLRTSSEATCVSCITLSSIFLAKALKVSIRSSTSCRSWCSLGICSVSMKWAPTISSFSARRLPSFHCLSSAHIRKCSKPSYWESTGWLVMWFIHRTSRRLRFSMKSSSKRPVACFSGRWGTEITVNLCSRRLYSQSKCL
ncbi:hypothetical protein EYF80_009868 [Liparis tanakae]|uniref:Uncharacterized protein n=1 Tax=Liparis tanakae TaxID=230148 RepID=A0A4Z2IPS6_9TELE|nr:hypothetical protein EYF80_009868 [Liparis tanakae]